MIACTIYINNLLHFIYLVDHSFCSWQRWIWTPAAAERTRRLYSGFTKTEHKAKQKT